jgi:hypothetical protein
LGKFRDKEFLKCLEGCLVEVEGGKAVCRAEAAKRGNATQEHIDHHEAVCVGRHLAGMLGQRLLSRERLGYTWEEKIQDNPQSPGCLACKPTNLTGHQALIVLVLISAPPALMAFVSATPPLMATFTASSIGSLRGTSIRSRPCS